MQCVVDDEAMIRELLSGSLRFAGYDVVTAASGAEALGAAASQRPDLVLLDVMMPECDVLAVTPTEYRLLRFLMANAGRVVSKSQIFEHVWAYNPSGEGNVVEPCISYLRRKVDQREPRLIHTIRGVGYVLRIPPP